MRRFLPSLRVPIVLWISIFPLSAAPIITEFLASNTTGLDDEDGTKQDWIEIHNPDGTVANLSGYHLTDDETNPTRWTFPAGVTIQPGDYLVVFASSKDRRDPNTVLHTNFALSDGGEYLALTGPGGTPVVSSYQPAAQSANVSYGVASTAQGALPTYFNTPTPGTANNTATAPAEPVKFSLPSGTFPSTTPISITLSVNSPTATIRYTTNRSVPTAASTLYEGTPIPVTANTRIRARAFEPGRPDGPVVSETYFALDAAALTYTSPLPIVVTTTWGTGVADNVTISGHIMVFEPKAADGNVAKLTNAPDLATPCSLERRGSSTAGDPKYSLTVETWDENNADRDFSILGMPAEGDWVMHAPYNFDRSLMHNDLAYRLSRDMGRYATRTQYVEHFHNTTVAPTLIGGALTGSADYFGVYSFMEKIGRDADRVDVERMTTTDNTAPNVQGGYMFKVDRLDPGDVGLRPLAGQTFAGIGNMGPGDNLLAWVYPKEKSTDPTLVVTQAQRTWLAGYIGEFAGVLTNDSVFMDPVNGYSKYIAVGAAIDHQILNTAAKNVDAMRLSAYWYKSRFGKLTAGPVWDFDRAMGSTDGRDLNPSTWRGDGGDLGTDFFHYPWYREMFRDPNFWQEWIDRYHELRKTVLSTAAVHARIDQFAAQLNPGDAAGTPAKRNISRWNTTPRGVSGATPGTNGTYPGEVQWLKNWWATRLTFMDNQFMRPPVSTPPSGPVSNGAQVVLTSPSLSTQGVKIYYTTDGTDPRKKATVPEPPAGTGTIIATLIAANSPVRGIVPTSATSGGPTGVEWRTNPFDDSSWLTNGAGTPNGIGYDDDLAVSYLPAIGLRWSTVATPVQPNNATNTMRNTNGSSFARHVFEVTPAQAAMLVAPNKLILQARYDDGYIAWINGGTPVSTSPNATAITPAWNSVLNTSREATTNFEDIDITASMSRITAGTNVLALQLMNGANTASSDALMTVKLVIQAPPAPYTPALSPSAIEYTGPITINAATQITARTVSPTRPSDPPTTGGGGTGTVPNGSSWSAIERFVYLPGAVAANQGNLRISEVLYNPEAPASDESANGFNDSNDFEFIRLTNTGATPVDLTGIYFSQGVTWTAEPSVDNLVPPGQSVVIVNNDLAFIYRNGTTFKIAGNYDGNLADSGEHLVLNDRTGAVIADFTYGDESPWPDAADDGYSLLYVSGDPALPASWATSGDPGGTGVGSYNNWLRRYFPNSDHPFQPMSQDDDGDGLNNLGEYAFVTDPRSPSSGQQAAGRAAPGNPAGFAVRRRAGVSDLTWIFETATGLNDWTPSAAAPESVVNHNDGTETVTWRPAAAPGTRLFMRVRVTNP